MSGKLLSKSSLIEILDKLKEGSSFPEKLKFPISSIEELSEGNVNQVFRITFENSFSTIIKYAPPFAYRFQEISINSQRNMFEVKVLETFFKKNAQTYPEVYYCEPKKNLMVMQDLKNCVVMRDALIQGHIFENFKQHALRAILCYVGNIPKDMNIRNTPFSFLKGIPELQEITQKFVFQIPFGIGDFPQGCCLEQNMKWVEENIFKNESLQINRSALEKTYYYKHEALIHGDLHTGSILLNQKETFIIDPEFACLGPISFDIGMLIANLIISFVSSEIHLREFKEKRIKFQSWLLECLDAFWNEIIDELVDQGFNREALIFEINGYCAIEMIRRTIGPAKVKDLLMISDKTVRAKVEKTILKFSVLLLENAHDIEIKARIISSLRGGM